ncbi:MAG: 3-deoxy-manno-octulosonate cytidylyltransferase [Vampirovibrionales bacterium]|nr:3-deoxy-manno-octulosonate cytidylyltransferase [Vampirovibrionales bacterium]
MTSAKPKILAVIPARYASSRFPGKPLVEISQKPMIQHVWQRVSGLSQIDRVIIATDDTRIKTACEGFGASVAMTSPNHPSGTDRVWEVARQYTTHDWILNVQGDEPQINPDDLQKALTLAQQNPVGDIITLVSPITSAEDFEDPNIVKAVLAQSSSSNAYFQALYFSRSPLPFNRDDAKDSWQSAYRHIGIYLYRRSALEKMTALPPSPLELLEKLEQLRALENNLSILAIAIEKAPIGIDTPEDLKKLSAIF